jgi:hypothetical protein
MRSPVLWLALVLPLPAQQTIVVPPQAAAVDGNSADQAPFGSDRSRHVQFIDGALLGGLPRGARIVAIAYRRDAAVAGVLRRERPREAPPRPRWAIRIAHWDEDPAQPSPTFPAATDPRFAVAFVGDVEFPELPPPAAGPAPFTIGFPLTRPFQYRGGHLAIEHYVFHRKMVSYDYYVDAVDSRGAPARVTARPADPPAGLRATAKACGPPGALVALLHGAQASSTAELWITRPGSPPFLACRLLTDSLGSASADLPLPPGAPLHGGLELRWLGTSPTGTPSSSDLLQVDFAAEPSPSAAHMSVLAGYPDVEVEHGFVQRGRGLVLALRVE